MLPHQIGSLPAFGEAFADRCHFAVKALSNCSQSAIKLQSERYQIAIKVQAF